MNIYIAGLSYNVTDADLQELFKSYGEVASAKVITDRMTGRSRGFGFVEMPNDEEGQKAIEELNSAEYDGKVISVSVANPRQERPQDSGGRYHGGGGFRSGGGGFRKDSGYRRDGGYRKPDYRN
jgi:RNA recognition motif-containing protein